jgi:hypothetical protein
MITLLDIAYITACLLVASCGKNELPTGVIEIPTAAPTEAVVSNLVPTPTPTVGVPTATPTPTPTPTPTVTVVTYCTNDFVDCSPIVCAALKAWHPTTTIIRFPINIASIGITDYVFTSYGVFMEDDDGSDPVEIGFGTPWVITNQVDCTITITNGQLTSVTP